MIEGYCKECGKQTDNKFCSRKCRMDWIRRNNIKGAKKGKISDKILNNWALSGEWK